MSKGHTAIKDAQTGTRATPISLLHVSCQTLGMYGADWPTLRNLLEDDVNVIDGFMDKFRRTSIACLKIGPSSI